MRRHLILILAAIAHAAFTMACGGGGNVNVALNTNSNRSATNTMSNAMNSVSNAASSVSNSVSNAASSVTADGPDDFMKMAAQGGMAEVEMGTMASKMAQNAEVKQFGQMMVTDHTKANNELKALAAKKNITLPTDVGSHKSNMDELAKLKGAEFDKAYVDQMVSDHEDTVSAFEKQANSATDPEVKAFAAKQLPVLKKHLETIRALDAKVNK